MHILTPYRNSLWLLYKFYRWQSESKGLQSDLSPEFLELDCTCSPCAPAVTPNYPGMFWCSSGSVAIFTPLTLAFQIVIYVVYSVQKLSLKYRKTRTGFCIFEKDIACYHQLQILPWVQVFSKVSGKGRVVWVPWLAVFLTNFQQRMIGDFSPPKPCSNKVGK